MELLGEASNEAAYVYEPLPGNRAIRLLQLCPDTTQQHGFCVSIKAFPLDVTPPYCALSYTWQSALFSDGEVWGDDSANGDDADLTMAEIQCGDGKTLIVTQTAVDFLKYARREKLFFSTARETTAGPPKGDSEPAKEGPTHLWVDAICINQADLTERGAQVSLMADIYQGAKKTIVWLGEEGPPPGVEELLTTFVAEFVKLPIEFPFRKNDWQCRDRTITERLGEKACRLWRKEWSNLFAFLVRRRWFSRGWVVQEVLSRWLFDRDSVEIFAGSFHMSWWPLLVFLARMTSLNWRRWIVDSHNRADPYRTAFTMLCRSATTFEGLERNIRRFRSRDYARMREKFGCESDDEIKHVVFFEIIRRLKVQSFTDHRDTVYGCLGLLSLAYPGERTAMLIEPNYDASATQVLTDVAWVMLRSMPYLEVLSCTDPESDADLPSWVPDWLEYQGMTSVRSIASTFTGNGQYDASGVKSPRSSISVEGGQLMLVGTRVAIVSDRFSKNMLTNGTTGIFEWLLELLGSRDGLYSPTGEAQDQALCRTLVADIFDAEDDNYVSGCRTWWAHKLVARKRDLGPASNEAAMIDDLVLNARHDPATRWIPSLDAIRDAARRSRADNIIDEVIHRLWVYRRFISSDEGHFGLAHRSVRTGDEVWILAGGRTPYILRKRRRRNGYKLLGEAFLHGMMYGELATPEFVAAMRPVALS